MQEKRVCAGVAELMAALVPITSQLILSLGSSGFATFWAIRSERRSFVIGKA